MWIIFALGSAFFAGVTAILAKIGISNVDSNLATAIRTVVVLVFSWLMVLIVGSIDTIAQIDKRTLLFLIASGIMTGASWLCYFKALQLGNVNKVAPIDKSSTVLTIILSIIILGESIDIIKAIAIIAIALGTYMMIGKKDIDVDQVDNYKWMFYASLSAVFASLNAIFGKIGISNIESNLGTAIRTIVVLIMAWIVVFVTRKQKDIKDINKKSWIYICLSGVTTGLSWMCYYRALQAGPASVVIPIDKLSIVVTIVFSYIFLDERLPKKAIIGLIGIVIGTLMLLI